MGRVTLGDGWYTKTAAEVLKEHQNELEDIINYFRPLVASLAELERCEGSIAAGDLIFEAGIRVRDWAAVNSMRELDDRIKLTVGEPKLWD